MTATVTESSVTTTTTGAPTVTTVNAKAFAGLLTDVALFASKVDTLPVLCAVQLQRGTVDGKAVIVARATDRYALAESWVHCDGATTWPVSTIVVPTAGIKQILTVLKAAGSQWANAIVTVTTGDHGVQLTVNNMCSQATVFCDTDHSFPNGASLWPSGSSDVSPPVVRMFGPGVLARPGAVSKRRGTAVRIHADSKSAVLMTIGEDFRVLVMDYKNREGDGSAFAEPSYS